MPVDIRKIYKDLQEQSKDCYLVDQYREQPSYKKLLAIGDDVIKFLFSAEMLGRRDIITLCLLDDLTSDVGFDSRMNGNGSGYYGDWLRWGIENGYLTHETVADSWSKKSDEFNSRKQGG